MKVLIFFSEGLGDALMWLPLVKRIRQEEEVDLHAVFEAKFWTAQLFQEGSFARQHHTLPTGGKAKAFLWALRRLRRYDLAYLNIATASRLRLTIALLVANKVVTNYFPDRFPAFLRRRCQYVVPQADVLESVLNLRLRYPDFPEAALKEQDILLPLPNAAADISAYAVQTAKPYIVVQVSAGNNVVRFKNYPPEAWAELLSLIAQRYPDFNILLLGEPREVSIAETILQRGIPQVFSTAGKTSIAQLLALISGSRLLLGLDGGAMHIAACLGVPTFSLWGSTNPLQYGYQKVDPQKHRVFTNFLSCSPCYNWLNPNTSRVTDARDCPDIACMHTLAPHLAFAAFVDFFDTLVPL